jgi:transcriptional regulator with XRE-family HTH domain
MSDPWEMQLEALGAFIRSTRKNANLSLRQLAEMTRLSNPYLSQIERGLHQPSVRVIRLISDALNISAESLLVQAGLLHATEPDADAAAPDAVSAEAAILADERLSPEQKTALIAVYQSMIKPD